MDYLPSFVLLWVVIGAFHAITNWLEFNASVKNWVWDEANSESLPKGISFPRNALHREILRNSEDLQLRDAVFTIIMGLGGVVCALGTWVVHNWPECLVLGNAEMKKHPADCYCKNCPTRKIPRNDEVNLEPLRQRAGIFNNK